MRYSGQKASQPCRAKIQNPKAWAVIAVGTLITLIDKPDTFREKGKKTGKQRKK